MLNKKRIAGILGIVLCSMVLFKSPSESYLQKRVVQLQGPKGGSCTGTQIRAHSGTDYILSAAHCEVLIDTDNTILVRLDDTRYIKRKVIEVSNKTDLMLIEGMPNLKGLNYGDSINKQDHIRAFTHGAALDTYKVDGYVIQHSFADILLNAIRSSNDLEKCESKPKNKVLDAETIFGPIQVCVLHLDFTIAKISSVPGSSGGAALSDSGKIVGVITGGDGTFTLFVNPTEINEFMEGY